MDNIDVGNIDLGAVSQQLSTQSQQVQEIPNMDPQTTAFINNVASMTQQLNESDLLNCNEECQRKRKIDELLVKYEAAVKNVESADEELEDAERNYYVFSRGQQYYDNMMTDKYTKAINTELEGITSDYRKEYRELSALIKYNTDQRTYQDNYRKIMEYKGEQVSENSKNINDTESDVNVENRKVFYDSQKGEFYNKLNNALFYIYYIVVLVLAGIVFGIQKKYSNRKAIGVIVFLLAYPFIVNPLYNGVVKVYTTIRHILTYV